MNALPFVFRDGVEGARMLLSAVAGSMITDTGVTFSVVIVAFTLASSQFTPRLLRNFMRDVGNQVVLGIFIGTFAYCLCILRIVGGPTGNYIPRISITSGFLLTSLSIGALVYFIHHAASLIQAQGIIARIGSELDTALEPLYPEGLGRSAVEHFRSARGREHQHGDSSATHLRVGSTWRSSGRAAPSWIAGPRLNSPTV